MTKPEDPTLSAGAYALGALTADEAAEFEAHLARSESLRSEVAEMTDTAVALGLASPPVTPPADMRARLMGLLAITPQLPAQPDVVAETSSNVSPFARPAGSVQAAPGEIASVHTAQAEAAPAESASMPAAERAKARWFSRPGTLLAAAAAAVAVFLGGIFLGSSLQGQDAGSFPLAQAQAQASALAELNAAPDLQRTSMDVENGSTATLIWSGELSRSAVVFDDLDPLPGDRVYQAWYIDGDGNATSAGTFEAEGDATSFRVLDGSMSSGNTVGVTVEPEGGSEAPTTDPIVAIEAA